MASVRTESLKSRLEEELEEQRRRRSARASTTEAEMRERAERQQRVAALWDWIFAVAVAPRFAVLAAELGHCGPLERQPHTCAAVMSLAPTDALPNTIRLSMSLSWPPPEPHALLRFEVGIIPILGDLDREASFPIDPAAPDLDAIEAFIDERLVRFVSDYGRLQDPRSPYQVGREVTDPVCLMSFTIPEAASQLSVGGKTYYFCSKDCEQSFAEGRAPGGDAP